MTDPITPDRLRTSIGAVESALDGLITKAETLSRLLGSMEGIGNRLGGVGTSQTGRGTPINNAGSPSFTNIGVSQPSAANNGGNYTFTAPSGQQQQKSTPAFNYDIGKMVAAPPKFDGVADGKGGSKPAASGGAAPPGAPFSSGGAGGGAAPTPNGGGATFSGGRVAQATQMASAAASVAGGFAGVIPDAATGVNILQRGYDYSMSMMGTTRGRQAASKTAMNVLGKFSGADGAAAYQYMDTLAANGLATGMDAQRFSGLGQWAAARGKDPSAVAGASMSMYQPQTSNFMMSRMGIVTTNADNSLKDPTQLAQEIYQSQFAGDRERRFNTGNAERDAQAIENSARVRLADMGLPQEQQNVIVQQMKEINVAKNAGKEWSPSNDSQYAKDQGLDQTPAAAQAAADKKYFEQAGAGAEAAAKGFVGAQKIMEKVTSGLTSMYESNPILQGAQVLNGGGLGLGSNQQFQGISQFVSSVGNLLGGLLGGGTGSGEIGTGSGALPSGTAAPSSSSSSSSAGTGSGEIATSGGKSGITSQVLSLLRGGGQGGSSSSGGPPTSWAATSGGARSVLPSGAASSSGSATGSTTPAAGTSSGAAPGDVKYNPAAGVEQWRGLVEQALKDQGLDVKYTDGILKQMERESGGDPGNVNDYDINAQNGDPSKGLMQVIGSTYQANARPGFEDLKYQMDPYNNIWAAIHYTIAQYGIGKLQTWLDAPVDSPEHGAYKEGAWNIKQNQIARVHEGEMIIPKVLAETMREALQSNKVAPAEASSGGTVNINVTLNGASEEEARRLVRIVQEQIQQSYNVKTLTGS